MISDLSAGFGIEGRAFDRARFLRFTLRQTACRRNLLVGEHRGYFRRGVELAVAEELSASLGEELLI